VSFKKKVFSSLCALVCLFIKWIGRTSQIKATRCKIIQVAATSCWTWLSDPCKLTHPVSPQPGGGHVISAVTGRSGDHSATAQKSPEILKLQASKIWKCCVWCNTVKATRWKTGFPNCCSDNINRKFPKVIRSHGVSSLLPPKEQLCLCPGISVVGADLENCRLQPPNLEGTCDLHARGRNSQLAPQIWGSPQHRYLVRAATW
jgi:hypothetical protein